MHDGTVCSHIENRQICMLNLMYLLSSVFKYSIVYLSHIRNFFKEIFLVTHCIFHRNFRVKINDTLQLMRFQLIIHF